jgi:hypothetical protein
MPETPVDHDSEPSPAEHNVSPASPTPKQWYVDTVPHPPGVQFSAKREFWCSVASPLALEPSPDRR